MEGSKKKNLKQHSFYLSNFVRKTHADSVTSYWMAWDSYVSYRMI